MRRVALVKQEVDDVQKAIKCTVVEIVTNGNERSRDTASYANGVLSVKVRFNAGLILVLRI